MINKQLIKSLSHEYIESLNILDIQYLQIENNKADEQTQATFSLLNVQHNDNNYKNSMKEIFNVYFDSNKMKFHENSFNWYRNRNIPTIKIMMKQDFDKINNEIPEKGIENNQKKVFTFYMNACYINKDKLSCTNLKGEQYKQNENCCKFESLKFEKTSFILNDAIIFTEYLIQNHYVQSNYFFNSTQKMNRRSEKMISEIRANIYSLLSENKLC